MSDPIKIHTWQVIEEKDFSELVRQVYNRPFRYQQLNFDANESISHLEVYTYADDVKQEPWYLEMVEQFEMWKSYEFGIDPKYLGDVGSWRENLEFERGEILPVPVDMITQDLCLQNLIPEGDYRLYISW